MTSSNLLALAVLAATVVMAFVVLYFSLAGAPGMVSLSPPPGSPRWPVYAFFVPWFVVAFMSRDPNMNQFVLWIRVCSFLVVLAAFFISWRRARANPVLPPRV